LNLLAKVIPPVPLITLKSPFSLRNVAILDNREITNYHDIFYHRDYAIPVDVFKFACYSGQEIKKPMGAMSSSGFQDLTSDLRVAQRGGAPPSDPRRH
jgi:hypothetical protein